MKGPAWLGVRALARRIGTGLARRIGTCLARLVGTGLAVIVAGCGQPSTTAGPFAEVWPELHEQADSLFAIGATAATTRTLRAAQAVVRAPYAPEWQRRELAQAIRADEFWRRAGAGVRTELVRAAAGVRAARLASHRDSIGPGEQLAADAYHRRLELLGADAPSTAIAALEYADLSFRLSRTARTDSLSTHAAEVLERAYGPRHPDLALALELQARTLKNFHGGSALPRALDLYREALRMRVETLGPHALGIASVYHEIGNLERLRHHSVAALDAFRMALSLRREAYGPVHDAVASTLTAMAILEGGRSHFYAAESLAGAAIVASPPGSSTPPMSRAFRLGVWGQLLRHNGHPQRAVQALRTAVALNEQAWSLSPRDEGSTIQSGLSVHGDLALALAELGSAEEALNVLERGTSRILLERSGASSMLDSAGWFARVQRTLAADEALVSWVRSRFAVLGSDDAAWAVVVRDSGPPRWIRLPATAGRLPGGARLRDVFWGELRNAGGWPVRLPGGERVQRLSREMRVAWFDPVEPALAGVRQLLVFSPEQCGGGPLEALGDDHDGWLADRYAVSYTNSASLHALAREHARAWLRSSPALVLGDPSYRRDAVRPWARLAGSREEVASVTEAFPGADVRLGDAANAPALRSMAASGALERLRLIHIAAHTKADGAHLLESQLVLAPTGSGEDASYLSAREIATQWRLNADLVCLTGCRSASGMSSAAQGWLGFQYAFLRAGARSVLVSLWPVDDAAAALLVKAFYADLARSERGGRLGSRSQALMRARQVVREWRDSSGLQPFAHPAYWSGFALIGEPGCSADPVPGGRPLAAVHRSAAQR